MADYTRSITEGVTTQCGATKSAAVLRSSVNTVTLASIENESTTFVKSATSLVVINVTETKYSAYSKNCVDTPIVNSSNFLVANYLRLCSSSTNVVDTLSTVNYSYRTNSEAATLSSSIARVVNCSRYSFPTIVISDFGTFSISYTRFNSSLTNIADTTVKSASNYRSNAETSTVTDTPVFSKVWFYTNSESISVTSAANRITTSVRSVLELVITVLNLAKQINHQRFEQDLSSSSETTSILKTQIRTNADTIVPAEPSTIRIVQTVRYPFSQSSLSDFARRSITIEFQFSTENVSVTITGRGTKGYEVASLSTSSANDIISTAKTFGRSHVSAITNVTDFVNYALSNYIRAIENVTCDDSNAHSNALVRAAQELISISSLEKRIGLKTFKVYEIAHLASSFNKALSYSFKVYENRYPIVVSSCAATSLRTSSESITISPVEIKRFLFNRINVDNLISVSASITVSINYVRLLSDSSNLVVNAAKQVNYFRLENEQKIALSYPQRFRGFQRTNSDTLITSSSHDLPYHYDQFKTAFDQYVSVDEVQTLFGANKFKTTPVNVTDQFSVIKHYNLTVNELAFTALTTKRVFTKIREHSDQTYEINDYGRRVVNHVRNSLDSLSINMSTLTKTNLVRYPFSQVNLNDTKNVETTSARTNSLAASIGDTASRSVLSSRGKLEYVTLNEVLTQVGDNKVKYENSYFVATDALNKQVDYHRFKLDQSTLSDTVRKQRAYTLSFIENASITSEHKLPYNYDQNKINLDASSVSDHAQRIVQHVRHKNIEIIAYASLIRGSLREAAENIIVSSSNIFKAHLIRRITSYTHVSEYLCYPRTKIKQELASARDIATLQMPTNLSAVATFDSTTCLLTATVGLLSLDGQSYRVPPTDCVVNVYFGTDSAPSFRLYPNQAKDNGCWEIKSRLTTLESANSLILRVSISGGSRTGSVNISPLINTLAVPHHTNPMQ